MLRKSVQTENASSSNSNDMVADAELFAAIQEGDEHAFEIIFHRYYAALCHFVANYVSRTDIAKEIVQEVFYRVWMNRTNLRDQSAIKTYLYSTAKNHTMNFLRREKITKRSFVDGDFDSHVDNKPSPNSSAETTVLMEELLLAFNTELIKLPESQRTVVTLRWHHHMGYAEIAEIMGISVKGVETQHLRAIKKLRASLEKFRG